MKDRIRAVPCCDLKTKLLCWSVEGIVFLPYGHFIAKEEIEN